MHRRRTDDLHAHRLSQSATAYFVTCCTRNRRNGLTEAEIAAALRAAIRDLDASNDTATLAFTIMPDHIHWLFTLGNRLTLGQTVGKWKSTTLSALRSADLDWQRDYFEHRLRPDEDREAYARYVLLNPYSAGLLAPTAAWPHWYCPEPLRFLFNEHLAAGGGIPPEWVRDKGATNLAIGE